MYNVCILPSAKQDMLDIVSYIANDIKNPDAADKLSMMFLAEIEQISAFPYSRPVFLPIRPLSHEYRRAPIKNYMLFYWIDEPQKTVTIARVIYAKRNICAMLEN